MSNTIATAWVEIRSKGDKGKNEAREQATTMAKEATLAFAQFFTAAVFVDQMNKAIRSATDLGESINAVQVSFGPAAEGVLEIGENAARSLGLSESAFNALAVRFSSFAHDIAGPGGDVVGVLDDLTTRAADFASVMNIDVAEAARLFQSGLAGETEPLRQYGIDLSAAAVAAHAVEIGVSDGTRALTEDEKVRARYSLLMQETARVAGDFANTADSAANRQRILSAEFENARAHLGEALLPVFSQVVGVLTKLVEGFSSLPGPVQTGLVALLGITAVAGPVKNVTAAFGGLTSIVSKLGASAGPIGVITAAVGIAYLAVDHFSGRNKELEARSAEVAAALMEQADQTLRVTLESAGAETAVEGLAAANQMLNNSILSGEAGERITQSLGAIGRQSEEALAILSRLADKPLIALQELAEEAGVTGMQMLVLTDAINETDNNGRKLEEFLINKFMMAFDVTRDAAREMVAELMPTASALEELQDQAENMVDSGALTKAAASFLNAAAAASEEADQLIRLAEEQVGASRTSDQAVEVYQRYIQLLAQSDQATQDAVLSTGQLGATTADAAGGIDILAAAAAAADPAIAHMADQAGLFEANMISVEKIMTPVSNQVKETGRSFLTMGDDLAGIYEAVGGLEEEFGPLVDRFADAEVGAEDFADETATAARRARELERASSTLGDSLAEAATAADDLQSALDRINAPADDLREATRGVWEELDNMAGALEENGNDFDASTEAGRANQRQLEATRDAILAHGIALVQNGSSATEAAGDIAYNTEALREQMLAAGLTEKQVDALIEAYGLTPEQVTTAIELAGIERANRLIEQHNANLDKIPTRLSTYIDSLIDQGKLNQAEYLLNNLARLRVASIVASVTNRGGSTFVMQAQAEGGYVDHAGLFLRGEAGPEAVLPLDRPSRIRDLLADARIGAPIAAALGGDSYVGASNSLSIGAINVADRRDLPEALDEVDSWWWRFRTGARA